MDFLSVFTPLSIVFAFGSIIVFIAHTCEKYNDVKKQKDPRIIISCNKCNGTNLSPIQDTKTSIKKYRAFIIKLFIAFLLFSVIVLIISKTEDALNPYAFMLFDLEKAGDIFKATAEVKTELFFILFALAPWKYVIGFFLILNILFYLLAHFKYGTNEIVMVCHNCGYINRPYDGNEEEVKNESNEENHS